MCEDFKQMAEQSVFNKKKIDDKILAKNDLIVITILTAGIAVPVILALSVFFY